MAKKKGKSSMGMYIGIAVGVVVIGGGVWWFLRMKKKRKEQLANSYTSPSGSSSSGGGSSSGGSSSSNTPSQKGCGGGYSNTSFPLGRGSCGQNVVKLQKYLGISSDGKFGGGTESAVKSSQNLISNKPIGWSSGYGKVSASDFNKLPI